MAQLQKAKQILLWVGCLLTCEFAHGQTTNDFTVAAAAGFPGMDTGLNVASGTTVQITASGTAWWGHFDSGYAYVNPDGSSVYQGDTVLTSAPVGALICRVGTGPWRFVGSSNSFTSTNSGSLILLFNDVETYYFDNGGTFYVRVILGLPDLNPTSMSWNTSLGGADFTYSVQSGPLNTATTAKLFWASGSTRADIIGGTPVIFTQNIPIGASGPSAVINVPAANFANPPATATYVLLVLDADNLVQESEEGNNIAALALCPVGPLTTQHMNEPAYDESYLPLELRQALTCFRDAVATLGGQAVPTSGYRPTAYQAHLYELRTKFIELSRINGIIPYVDGRRPKLATTPGTAVCQQVVDSVNSEIQQHLLVARTDGTPAVAPPGTSLHELGRAVDVSVSGLPRNVSGDTLARNCGLYRPYPVNDPVHYELTDESPRRQITFTGNSPVNILVEDPSGRRIGFDSVSNAVVNQIGQYATYSGAGSTPQVIQIFPNEVRSGDYRVSGVGTGSGAYSIGIQITGEDGAGPVVERILGTGTASAGQPLAPIPPINCVLATIFLQVELLGQDLLLLGPPWATNIVVESTSNLKPTAWTEVPQTISPSDGILITNLPPGPQFFRLRTK